MVKRLNQITPDIVILDTQIPHVSGGQILRHIRQSDTKSYAGDCGYSECDYGEPGV
jgi:DNA-binding response OmpR family regulator